MSELTEALRQFKHNDGSGGFVFAYDKETTDRIVANLEQQLKTAKVDGVREFSSSLSKEYLTKGINNKFEGFSVSQHIEAQAKVFANNLEGK